MFLFDAAGFLPKDFDRTQEFDIEPGELNEEQLQIIMVEAEAYLRASGIITPEVWLSITTVEKAALVTAGNRIRVSDSVNTGEAAQGLEGLMNVQSELDGGAEADRMSLAIACASAAANTKNKVVAR